MIEKGISFDGLHSFNGLNLILSRVDITPAVPKTNYVDIPGGDGSLDMTEAHGEVKFKDRTLTFTFTMRPDDPKTWEEKQTQVSNALNGKRIDRIVLDNDSGYYWAGRCAVSQYASNKKVRQIVVTATVSPYKYEKEPSVQAVSATTTVQSVIITNEGRKTVVPSITVGDITYIRRVGSSDIIHLASGSHKNIDLFLKQGNNEFEIQAASGSHGVRFEWTEGEL